MLAWLIQPTKSNYLNRVANVALCRRWRRGHFSARFLRLRRGVAAARQYLLLDSYGGCYLQRSILTFGTRQSRK